MGSNIATTNSQYTWILWYHDPQNKDYSLNSYVKIATVATPQQFWTVVDTISKEAWESGMFFFMRLGYRPLWDSDENKAGGAWSKKIDAAEAHTTFIDMMVHCMAGEVLSSRTETLVGVTLSPKGPSSIIKIWNTTKTVNTNTHLNMAMHKFKVGDDVTYVPHDKRPV